MDGLYGWPLFPSVAATSIRCCPVARASLACVESPKRWLAGWLRMQLCLKHRACHTDECCRYWYNVYIHA